MSDSPPDPGHPAPAPPGGGRNGPPLLDILDVPVPSGPVESPLQDRHALDFHLGDPVHVSCCRLDSRERRGLQTHGLFCVIPASRSASSAMISGCSSWKNSFARGTRRTPRELGNVRSR